MDKIWRSIIWQQFGAAIDMLQNAMLACPDELWSRGEVARASRPWVSETGTLVEQHAQDARATSGAGERRRQFWYLVYHSLFWLDLYLSDSVEGFSPPPPFALDEMDPAGVCPEQPYTKDELLTYLEHGREKCRGTIAAMTDERAVQRCGFDWVDVNNAELLLYNMRHVQHHAAQLNLILRQTIDSAPGWVSKTKGDL